MVTKVKLFPPLLIITLTVISVKDENDAFISLAEEALSVFGDSALPYLVNFIPACEHFKISKGYFVSNDLQ